MSEPSARAGEPAGSAPGSRPAEVDRSGPRPAPEPLPAESAQYLTFRLAGDEYGLAILQIREILEFSPLTPIPLTPEWIRGVLNLRGNVVPVIDLALKFGLAETAVTDRTCIVIVEVELEDEMSVMGLMVDAVSEVVELDPSALEPPPQFGSRVRVDYLEAMGKIDRRLVLLLDADRVLSAEELMITLDGAAGESAEPGAGERG